MHFTISHSSVEQMFLKDLYSVVIFILYINRLVDVYLQMHKLTFYDNPRLFV